MSDLRTAALQALEALEKMDANGWPMSKQEREATAALRAALAEQAQPVTGHDPDTCDEEVFVRGDLVCVLAVPKELAEAAVRIASALTGDRYDWHYAMGRVHVRKLAAAPEAPTHPAPQPLTDEELDRMRSAEDSLAYVTFRQFRVIARAVERAHGIGGQDE